MSYELKTAAGTQKRSRKERIKAGQRVSLLSIACNIVLVLAKGALGIAANSISILADAANNLSDAASNIISLFGFKLASRPADSKHPFGHGRYEYIAALVVALLVCTVGFELIINAVKKILTPEPFYFKWLMVYILSFSIIVKLLMMYINKKLGKKIASQTLIATAADSRNDALATAAVLISAFISYRTNYNLDGWIGLCVGIFILCSSISLIKQTIDPLLGSAASPQEVEYIRQKILSYNGVLGTHDLMIHDYGFGRQFASAHVELAAETDPLKSHDLLDQIEQDFKHDDGIIMTLHSDPIVTYDPNLKDMHGQIMRLAAALDPSISIHDVRVVFGTNKTTNKTTLAFDCVRPKTCALSPEELKDELIRKIHTQFPEYTCDITIDSGYLSTKQ